VLVIVSLFLVLRVIVRVRLALGSMLVLMAVRVFMRMAVFEIAVPVLVLVHVRMFVFVFHRFLRDFQDSQKSAGLRVDSTMTAATPLKSSRVPGSENGMRT